MYICTLLFKYICDSTSGTVRTYTYSYVYYILRGLILDATMEERRNSSIVRAYKASVVVHRSNIMLLGFGDIMTTDKPMSESIM